MPRCIAPSRQAADNIFSSPLTVSWSADEVSELERFLRGALKADGLELFYQPQYSMVRQSLQPGSAVPAQPPRTGAVPADRFLPIAEECGLIVPLGNWVLDEVCRQSIEWQSRGLKPAAHIL